MNPALLEQERLVRELGLTDICLSTEANYTRHLTQADFTTAFQDHPAVARAFPLGDLDPADPPLRTRKWPRDSTGKKTSLISLCPRS